jgi:hypothetical protein
MKLLYSGIMKSQGAPGCEGSGGRPVCGHKNKAAIEKVIAKLFLGHAILRLTRNRDPHEERADEIVYDCSSPVPVPAHRLHAVRKRGEEA